MISEETQRWLRHNEGYRYLVLHNMMLSAIMDAVKHPSTKEAAITVDVIKKDSYWSLIYISFACVYYNLSVEKLLEEAVWTLIEDKLKGE